MTNERCQTSDGQGDSGCGRHPGHARMLNNTHGIRAIYTSAIARTNNGEVRPVEPSNGHKRRTMRCATADRRLRRADAPESGLINPYMFYGSDTGDVVRQKNWPTGSVYTGDKELTEILK
ncbi:hypothetical protein J6590_001845 [Homalodisca vitripennis]|nr:hypothetical protein J6590_001845 [Homalodisca vitripennis]